MNTSHTPVTGDQRLVKHINRVALLRLLRDVPGLSRAELSDRSGLTRSTISLLTKELIDEGWLIEDDAVVTGQLGRRPVPLRLDGRKLALIGAELTPDTLRVVTTSIHGDVLESRSAELRHIEPEAACHQLVEMVTVLAQHVTQAGQQVLGIGVALPGAVDAARGQLRVAPNIGWRDVPVGERLRAELAAVNLGDLPVLCQNEADLAAIGEVEFGPRPVDSPLIYISCGVGLGSGIVLGHTLFTGATGAAGEIGHTTLQVGGRVCSCGRRGCAEAYVGLRAIAEAAGLRPKGSSLDHAGLRARISTGDAQVSAAFREAGEHLGVLLQNVWTTFDPRAIVLGGEVVSLGGSAFVEPALATLARYAQAAGVAAPQVRVGRFNELAAAVGGAAYALHALMNPYQARG